MREIKDKEEKVRIALLRSEAARLERVAGYIFREEEDLNIEELLELEQELKRVQKEIADRLSSEPMGPSMSQQQQPLSSVQHQVKDEKP